MWRLRKEQMAPPPLKTELCLKGTENEDQVMIVTGMVQGLVIIVPQILNVGCQIP